MTVEIKVLGIAQDGGRPHAACRKPCCAQIVSAADIQYPVALGITESDGTTHLIEATPNVADQLRFVWKIHGEIKSAPCDESEKCKSKRGVDHVWITHAHMGHSDGLRQFGREVMSARGINLHVSSPSMTDLISRTPMWNIMIHDWKNFTLSPFESAPEDVAGQSLVDYQIQNFAASSSKELSIEAMKVPHRGELSDMHAFLFRGPQKSLLFLPDHDTWEETLQLYECKTIRSFLKVVKVDIALIDGTFWSIDELGGHRDQRTVPHPPVKQTLELLGKRQAGDPEIYFTHLNHTNPLFDASSKESVYLASLGWRVTTQGMTFVI